MVSFRRLSLVKQGEEQYEADDGKNTEYQTYEYNGREGNTFGLFDLLVFMIGI